MSGGSSGGGGGFQAPPPPPDHEVELERMREAAATQTQNVQMHDAEIAREQAQTRDNAQAAQATALEQMREAAATSLAQQQTKDQAAAQATQFTQQQSAQQAQWTHDSTMAAQAKQDTKDTQAAADAKVQQQKNDFSAAEGTAKSGALATYTQKLIQQGLDPTTAAQIAGTAVSNATARVPNLDPNPSNYYTDDFVNQALTDATNSGRTGNTNKVNQVFGSGFESNLIPDTAGDSYINSILNDQQSHAQEALDFAKARGTVNDQGYTAGQSKLSQQAASAKSTLSSLGTSAIAKDRSGLDAIKGNALTDANAWSPGSTSFDPSSYYTKASDAAGKYTSNLQGDITSALGSTNLFNVNDILLAGGGSSGPTNPATTAGNAGGSGVPTITTDTKRGLGTPGVF